MRHLQLIRERLAHVVVQRPPAFGEGAVEIEGDALPYSGNSARILVFAACAMAGAGLARTRSRTHKRDSQIDSILIDLAVRELGHGAV